MLPLSAMIIPEFKQWFVVIYIFVLVATWTILSLTVVFGFNCRYQRNVLGQVGAFGNVQPVMCKNNMLWSARCLFLWEQDWPLWMCVRSWHVRKRALRWLPKYVLLHVFRKIHNRWCFTTHLVVWLKPESQVSVALSFTPPGANRLIFVV